MTDTVPGRGQTRPPLGLPGCCYAIAGFAISWKSGARFARCNIEQGGYHAAATYRLEASVRKFLPIVLALLFPLAACENIYVPDDADGSYRVARVTLSSTGQTRSATPSVVLYEGSMTRGATRYDVIYELVDARIDLTERNGRYTFTGVYRLTERNGRFPTEVETGTEYGTYDIYGDEISFQEDRNSDFFLDASGKISGRTIEVGVYDPIFEEKDFYQFRR